MLKSTFIIIYDLCLYRKFSDSVIQVIAETPIRDKSEPPVSYGTAKKHPLSAYVRGDYQTRGKILAHPNVESILYHENGKIFQFFWPRQMNDYLDNGCQVRFAGLLAKTLAYNTIVSFPVDVTLGDFYTFVPEKDNVQFPAGKSIGPDVFLDPAKPDATKNKPPPPCATPVSVVCISI